VIHHFGGSCAVICVEFYINDGRTLFQVRRKYSATYAELTGIFVLYYCRVVL
jgi:hypothetical protein